MFAADDDHVLFVSKNRSHLNRYFNFVLAEDSVLEDLVNKKLQYQYADSIGVPIPVTYYQESSGDIEEIAKDVGYPCVIKPIHSHLWQRYRRSAGLDGCVKLIQVDSPEQLLRSYQEMASSGVELMVEESIQGGDDRLYSLYTYLDRDSAPLATFVMRKLRQWPALYGNGSYDTSDHNTEVVDLGLKLLRRVGYRGVAGIEFKKTRMMVSSS